MNWTLVLLIISVEELRPNLGDSSVFVIRATTVVYYGDGGFCTNVRKNMFKIMAWL